MSSSDSEPVCYVVPGQERVLSNLLGGTYALQECGVFEVCDDAVRRYYEGQAGWDYVEVWRCAPDLTRIGILVGLIAALGIALFITWKLKRKRKGVSVPILTESDEL